MNTFQKSECQQLFWFEVLPGLFALLELYCEWSAHDWPVRIKSEMGHMQGPNVAIVMHTVKISVMVSTLFQMFSFRLRAVYNLSNRK